MLTTNVTSDFKVCTLCLETKNIDCFEKHKKFSNSRRSQCKDCRRLKHIKHIEDIKKSEKPILTDKECSICKLQLSIKCFTSNIRQKDGVAPYCKQCRRFNDLKNKINKLIPIEETPFSKQCYKCKKILEHTCFAINRRHKDKRSNMCNQCKPKSTWNKEKQKESEKRYIEKHKDRVKQKWKRDSQKINRRVRDSLNKRIKEALLDTKKVTKRNTTFTYLGCTRDFFKKWIEFQFTDGMNWLNYGIWHFDHVKPCKAFDLSIQSEQLECFNWRNLQPLWGNENQEKSDKIDLDYISTHRKKSVTFESIFAAQAKEGELREQPESPRYEP